MPRVAALAPIPMGNTSPYPYSVVDILLQGPHLPVVETTESRMILAGIPPRVPRAPRHRRGARGSFVQRFSIEGEV